MMKEYINQMFMKLRKMSLDKMIFKWVKYF